MNIQKRLSFWVTLFMLAVIIAFVVMSFSYSAKARLFPLIVGIPGVIIGFVLIASEKWSGLLKPFEVNIGTDVKVLQESIDEEEKVELSSPELAGGKRAERILTCAGWMAGYAAIVLLVGFHPANFLLPFLYVKIHARAGWLKAILIGGITAGFMYLMFEFFMQVTLFQGVIFGEYLPKL